LHRCSSRAQVQITKKKLFKLSKMGYSKAMNQGAMGHESTPMPCHRHRRKFAANFGGVALRTGKPDYLLRQPENGRLNSNRATNNTP
jgi:hypothetical protein